MMILRIEILGPPVITVNGVEVTLSRTKGLALIGYLAVRRRPQRRAELAAMLWPDLPPSRGLASLRSLLWDIQQMLGKVIEGDRVQIHLVKDDVELDVQRFEHCLDSAVDRPEMPAQQTASVIASLQEAVTLYRGELLQGIQLHDCPAFEEWRGASSERLRANFVRALERLIAVLHANQRTTEAMPHAVRFVATTPLNEAAHGWLMRLYAAQGRPAEAIAQYARCVDLLREELGVQPSAELTSTYKSIRASQKHLSTNVASKPLSVPDVVAPAVPRPEMDLVGRARELSQIVERVGKPGSRLLTIVGAAGAGKTRLALEAASLMADDFQDGVRFVSIEDVKSPALLPIVMSSALDVHPGAEQAANLVIEHLRDKHMLLVLDGVERLAGDGRWLETLLHMAPRLAVLSTSRERLDVAGEYVLVVQGLPLAEARALFALAAERTSSFILGEADEAHVARISQLVEGNPLCIELAAAWTHHFSPAEIAQQLARGEPMSGPWDGASDSGGLHAAFLRSWRLLSADERSALARLSVFRAGATAAAAATVAGAGPSVLSSLLRKFLIQHTEEGRFALHPVVRVAARMQLAADLQVERETNERYATHLVMQLEALGRGDKAEPLLPDEVNLARTALREAAAQGRFDVVERGLDGLVGLDMKAFRHEALLSFLDASILLLRSRTTAGARLLEGRLLARKARAALSLGRIPQAVAAVGEALVRLDGPGADVEMARALLTAGEAALRNGHPPAARWCLRGALRRARAAKDLETTGLALSALAQLAVAEREPKHAERLLGQSIEMFWRLDDRTALARQLRALGELHRVRGEYDRAETVCREALAALGDADDGYSRSELRIEFGEVMRARGRREEAAQAYEQGLRLARVANPEGVAMALRGLSLTSGDVERARELGMESLEVAARIGARWHMVAASHALGLVSVARRDMAEALAIWKRAAEWALELGAAGLLMEILTDVAERSGGELSGEMLRALEVIAEHPMADVATRHKARELRGAQVGDPAPEMGLEELTAAILGRTRSGG